MQGNYKILLSNHHKDSKELTVGGLNSTLSTMQHQDFLGQRSFKSYLGPFLLNFSNWMRTNGEAANEKLLGFFVLFFARSTGSTISY